MKGTILPRSRRSGLRVAVLLASLCLAVGGQALVPSLAAAEPSMGEDCSLATVAIDCAFDDDDSGITGGSDSTGGSDPGSGGETDPGAGDAGSGETEGSDPGSGPTQSGIDDGDSDGGDNGSWGNDKGDPPEDDGSDYISPDLGPLIDTDEHGRAKGPLDPCDLLFRRMIYFTRPNSKAQRGAAQEWEQCEKSQAPPDPSLPSARVDKRLRNASSRQRKTSRNTKGRHVGRSTRPNRSTLTR